MKRRLHTHLRPEILLEKSEWDAGEFLEPLPEDYPSNDARAKKRQRVEAIATAYLNRGQVPVLLSTSLKRGPFNDGWKNPWTTVATQGGTHSAREIPETYESPIVVRAECTARRDCRKGRVVKVAREEPITDEQTIHSPAARLTPSSSVRRKRKRNKKRDQAFVEDLAQGVDATQPPELTRMPTGRSPPQSAPSNEWFRRRRAELRVPGNVDSPFQDTPYESPTHVRGGIEGEVAFSEFDAGTQSPTAYPKAPALDTQIQSSASAAMVFSPPSGQTSPAKHISEGLHSTNQYTPFGSPPAAVQTLGAHFESSVLRMHEDPSNEPQAQLALRRKPSRGDIQRSAETCATRPKTSTKQSERKRRLKGTDGMPHDFPAIAPPPEAGPASLSGSFIYRKVGNRKAAKGTTISAPQPINFGSSPVRPNPASTEKIPPRNSLGQTVPAIEPHESQTDHSWHSVLERRIEEEIADGYQGDCRRESGSTRQSMYSTQAAMMLAHLEFQDGTFPDSYRSPVTSQTPRKTPCSAVRIQSTPSKETTRIATQAPSPAITPFHAFNAELDRKLPDTSRSTVPINVPISTQDLFMAASPFAVSTVKKTKSTAPLRGSSLRFAMASYNDRTDNYAQGQDGYSSTPRTERSPLKDRNSQRSMMSSGKGTPTAMIWSQESMFSPQFRQRDTGALPQLSFGASLDGDVNFADQFLKNLDAMA